MCMSKVDIKVIIKNNDEVSEEKYVALKNKQKIEYFEKEFKTSLFLKDVVKIKRKMKIICLTWSLFQIKRLKVCVN